MAVTESQKKAVYSYKKRNYDFFNLMMEKGKREIIKEHAQARQESLNQFINRAIDNQLKADQAEEKDFSGLD
ncbi:MAG: hypothetical protein IKG47_00590 [Oscillospiraceae bacterium]|nr:hypothetical protein [Clostridiales bacterium]MBR3353843.1 hypothetical protein [Oscillospiraceae bacterium]